MKRTAALLGAALVSLILATSLSAQANVYPLKTDATLTYWLPGNADVNKFYTNWGNTPMAQEWQKKTGIKVKFVSPGVGMDRDQLNIMIATGELPDIIQWGLANGYSGGTAGAARNGVIRPLNDLLPKYAPNLSKLLTQDKKLDKMIKGDDSQYYYFPQVRDPNGMVWSGPIVRADWLKDLGLKAPETIDEWYTMLKAFKEKKGAVAALSINGKGSLYLQDAFVGAYKSGLSWFVDDKDKVQFGPATAGYKEFLTLWAKWYKEGLIDQDFALTDDPKLKELIDTNKAGAWVGNVGGSVRFWLDKKKGDPSFDVAGVKYPVVKKGDIAFLGQSDFVSFNGYEAYITTKAKNPDIAARFLDYFYGPEGSLLANFGVENTTYTMVNGEPKFTDFLFKNPTGLTSAQVQLFYTIFNGPYISDARKTTALQLYPQMPAAVSNWQKTQALDHKLPSLDFTEAEAKELKVNETDLNTLVTRAQVEFILGARPLADFDKYVEELKKLNLDRYTQIRQAAFDRYNKR